MNYHWNWRIFWEPAPNGTGTYLDMLLSGLVLTVETAICAWIIALIFGSIVGVMRTLPSKTASRIGFAYVEFFRNMPLLVQLFIWFFGLPYLGINLPAFFCGVVGMGMYSGAYVSEIVRGAIQSIARGQMDAARSLGMPERVAMRHVIVPQAAIVSANATQQPPCT